MTRVASTFETGWNIFRELSPSDALYILGRVPNRLAKTIPIPDKAKERFEQARKSFIRAYYSFHKQDFVSCLERLGLQKGDTVLVHCSYEKFEGFTGKPPDVIAGLLETIGPGGNLLMPTMPFTGPAVDYVSRGGSVDVVRSPSLMGIVSELFRRMKGVRRSVHPTHPVAACGPSAADLIADHHLATTPCGLHSPFAKLLDFHGKILYLGTGIARNTFFHTVDEFLEAELNMPVFTEQWYTLTCKDAAGNAVTCRTRLFANPSPRRRRAKVIRGLKERGVWREAKVGRLNVVLLSAKDILAVCQELAHRREYLYPF